MPPVGAAPDVPCIRCGYSLLGLPVQGVCPECGAPVAESLRGDRFRYSRPSYVRALHAGAFLVELVSLLWIPLAIIAAIMSGLVRTSFGRGTTLSIVLEGLISGSLIILWCFGWWMLTTRDPVRPDATDLRSRRLVRALVVVVAAPAIVLPFMDAGVSSFAARGLAAAAQGATVVEGLRTVLIWLALVAAAIGYFTSLAYISAIGPRFPDPSIGRNAVQLMWFPVWLTVGGVVASVVAAAFDSWLVGGFAIFAGFIAIVVAYVWWLWLIDHVRYRLQEARWMMQHAVLEPNPIIPPQ